VEDVRVFSRAMESMYNLSFSLVGGHSLGGVFAQSASVELKPELLVVMCSGAVQSAVSTTLGNGTKALFVVAGLDTIVRPEAVWLTLSQAVDFSVAADASYSVGAGALRTAVIDWYDHLTILYSDDLSREVISLAGATTRVPFLEVTVLRLAAALLWLGALALATPPRDGTLGGSTGYVPDGSVGWPRLAAVYAAAGLMSPVISAVLSFLPGLGTSSFFIGLFLSMALSIAIAMKVGGMRVKVDRPVLDPKSAVLGAAHGFAYVLGLNWALGANFMRLVPSIYALPAVIVSIPITVLFSVLDLGLSTRSKGFPGGRGRGDEGSVVACIARGHGGHSR